MSEGKIVDFDVPKILLNDETSVLYELTKKLSSNEKKLIFEIANGVKKIDLDRDYVPSQIENSKMETKSVKSFVYENKGADLSDDEIGLFHPSVQTKSSYSIAKSELEVRF